MGCRYLAVVMMVDKVGQKAERAEGQLHSWTAGTQMYSVTASALSDKALIISS